MTPVRADRVRASADVQADDHFESRARSQSPRRAYPEVIPLCRDNRYTTARQTLMGVLARAKSVEAFDVLIACLGDPTVRAHAIEALGRFGRADAISTLEAVSVQKGLYEYKAKETALRRLRRVVESRRGEGQETNR